MDTQRFGLLEVIDASGASWKVRCVCGITKSVLRQHLRRGVITSCGCRGLADLSGRRFGRLTVLGRSDRNDGRWVARCDCGAETRVPRTRLETGGTRSCGCLARDEAGLAKLTHGASRDVDPARRRLYGIWAAIKRRCTNPRVQEYRLYGGRGITVCDRWLRDFAAFEADMGPRPSPKHTVDRVDVNGPYSPENCRWATWKVQQRNRRNNILVDGRTLTEWAEELGVGYWTLRARHLRGAPLGGKTPA